MVVTGMDTTQHVSSTAVTETPNGIDQQLNTWVDRARETVRTAIAKIVVLKNASNIGRY